jgi:hypothetical protein
MSVSQWQLDQWSQPPNERNEEKCQRTVERIKRVISNHFGSSVELYLQGSYRNRTNVKTDSDVDIVAEHTDYFFHDISALSQEDQARYNQNRTPASYKFEQFKTDMHNLLIREFGGSSVQRKNKCIYVLKDAYRVNADVVPCYSFKRFYTYKDVEAQGIALLSDDGKLINNFPKQHYENGAQKNIRTDGKYKSVVRAIKVARNQLCDAGRIGDDAMSSFLLECLVWNVSDSQLSQPTVYQSAREAIKQIWNDMQNSSRASNYAEVSNLRWLLRGAEASQDMAKAKSFMEIVWNYIGYS